MLAEQRRHRILEVLRLRGGFASLTELAAEVGASESTIRRDLEVLEESGAAKRTHGGAFYAGHSPPQPYVGAEPAQWDKKQAIARCAARLIDSGDTLLLDGGSTTYELARLLVDRQLQIVTNSLPVANLFGANAYTDLVMVGGYVYPRTGVMLGPHANRMLSDINVRKALLSVAGIDERGFYNNNLLLVETERAMLHSAEQVIVLADSTKFGRQGLVHLCELGAVDKLVADTGISPEWRKKVAAAGVEVIVADEIENKQERSK
ncbi:MAG: DeoR/GlpR transcriptional regulator [Planctomycetia bacterium]|nr:DeoR/GlpR transcriptional regulator [Planctomycetia bacterium]